MAEALFKRELEKLHIEDVEVSSAGTLQLGGRPPTEEAIKVMEEIGIDISSHRASVLDEEMLKETYMVFVMERMHLEIIKERWPDASDKTHLLREYAGLKNDVEIIDPIGMPLETYKTVRHLIEEAITEVVKKL